MRLASLALILALTQATTAQAFADPPGFKSLAIGDHAPDFKLPGVDDKQYSLKSFADARLLLVVFTCNHCPTAQAYESRIIKLHADYKDRGVALVAISPNDDQATRSNLWKSAGQSSKSWAERMRTGPRSDDHY